MAEMPTCTKCGQPHWRFASCEDAPALAAKEVTREREQERLKVRPEPNTPPGYVRIGPGKFARATSHKPVYIEISPGRYGKADNYELVAPGVYRRRGN